MPEEVVLHVLGPRLESCGTHLHVGLLLWRDFFRLASSERERISEMELVSSTTELDDT